MSPNRDDNPYDWKGETPRHRIERPLFRDVRRKLLAGEGVCVIGGRGMGKSVLSGAVSESLRSLPDARCVFLPEPPLTKTSEAVLEFIARELDLNVEPSMDEILTAFSLGSDAQLVLCFDELDQYVRDPEFSRSLFNHLESVRRRARRRLGILVTGGLGALVLRDHLGSDFLSRADMYHLQPLNDAELHQLGRPFESLVVVLDDETLDAVRLASGGNPALATYAYQRLWEQDERDPSAVTRVFTDFRERNSEFIRSVHRAVVDSPLTATPRRIYEHILARGGSIPRSELLAHCEQSGKLHLELRDALDLLSSAGLIQVEGSRAGDPVVVRPIQSILALPHEAPAEPVASPRENLRRALFRLLDLMHRTGPDYYRSGGELVPEAVFSSTLCLGLRLLGWTADREPMEGGGRTDVKVALDSSPTPTCALLEVKRWGYADHQNAQLQVARSWTSEVRFGAVIVFGSYVQPKKLSEWNTTYKTTCLEPHGCNVSVLEVPEPLHCGFTARTTRPDGREIEVEHFLVNLPRRPD